MAGNKTSRGTDLLLAVKGVEQTSTDLLVRDRQVIETEPATPALARAGGEPLPVHSFHTLLGDLATLTRNVVRLGRDRLTAILATPTRTQHRALDLLGLTPTA